VEAAVVVVTRLAATQLVAAQQHPVAAQVVLAAVTVINQSVDNAASDISPQTISFIFINLI
jgi:hypothetical protein